MGTIRNKKTGEIRAVRPGQGIPMAHGMEFAEEWEYVPELDMTVGFDDIHKGVPRNSKAEGEGGERMTREEKARILYDTISATPLPSEMFKMPEAPESILSEAKRLVEGGERNQAYGPPEMDFKRIATMVEALLRHKLKDGEIILDSDIARIMICLKLSRSVWQMKRDNWVDIAGYAACGHRCETGEW